MSTQCSPNSCHTTKGRRSHDGSVVVIPMTDERDDILDELSVVAKPSCFTQTYLYQTIKPLLSSFYAAGLLIRIRFDKTGFRKYINLAFIYSTLILIMLTVNTMRLVTMFNKTDQFGSLLFSKLANIVWSVEALGHFAGFYVASCAYERLPKFFIEWEMIRKCCPESHAPTLKLAYICTVVMWILVMPFVGFTVYLTIWSDSHIMLLTPLKKGHPYVAVMIVFHLIADFYLNFAWIAPSVLMFLICKMLAVEFNQLKQKIKALADRGKMVLYRELEGVRQHHDKLCILVGYADNLFSMQIAGSFAGSVSIICLASYVLIMGDPSTAPRVFDTVYLMMAMVKVLMDCISGAMINKAVSFHRCVYLSFLYKLCMIFLYHIRVIKSPAASFY